MDWTNSRRRSITQSRREVSIGRRRMRPARALAPATFIGNASFRAPSTEPRSRKQDRIERRRGMTAVIGDVGVGRQHAPHRFANERLVIDEQDDRHGSIVPIICAAAPRQGAQRAAAHLRCGQSAAPNRGDGRLPERRDYNRIAERRTTDVDRLLPNRPTF